MVAHRDYLKFQLRSKKTTPSPAMAPNNHLLCVQVSWVVPALDRNHRSVRLDAKAMVLVVHPQTHSLVKCVISLQKLHSRNG